MRASIAILFLTVPLWSMPVLKDMSPRGAQRGASIPLKLSGSGLLPGARLETTVPAHITSMVPDEQKNGANSEAVFLIQLKKDAEPGLYPVRVVTTDGISNLMLFSVGVLPETVEAEIEQPRPGNNSAIKAEKLTVPAVVNGTLTAADIDYYSIVAKAGENLVFEVDARAAGSAIDPVIDILSASGKTIASNNDAPGLGVDARVEVKFAAAGRYLIRIRDARYSDQKQNFYRLKIGSYPYATSVFPIGGQRGEEVEFTLSGGNLPAPIQVRRRMEHEFETVAVPGSASLPFVVHASVLPAAAEASGLKEGVALNALLEKPGEVDRYKLTVKPGERWMVEVEGSPATDALITVFDPSGKKIAGRDDVGGADPALPFTVPDGVNEVTVAVEDILKRGGPEYGYRLQAARQAPDFVAELLTPQVNVPAGGTALISVNIQRRGFDGPIEVRIPNLPAGLSVGGGNVPSEAAAQDPYMRDPGFRSARAILTLSAAPDAKLAPGSELKLVAVADGPDGRIERPVKGAGLMTAVAGTKQNAVSAPWLGLQLPVAIAHALPASLKVPVALVRISQGFEYPLKYRIAKEGNARLTSPVRELQTGGVGNLRVNKGTGDKTPDGGSVLVATNFATPATTFDMIFISDAMVDGETVPVVSPAVSIQVVPGFEVTAKAARFEVRPNDRFPIEGTVRREPTFEGDLVRVQAADLPEGVQCAPAEVAGDQSTFSLACTAAANTAAGNYDFRLTSTAPNVGRKAKDDYKIADLDLKLTVPGAVQAAR